MISNLYRFVQILVFQYLKFKLFIIYITVRDPNKKIKGKQKLQNTIFLEEDNIIEEAKVEEAKVEEDINIHEIMKQMPDIPKTKNKSRKKQLKPNVKQTKRNLQPVKFIEVSETEI